MKRLSILFLAALATWGTQPAPLNAAEVTAPTGTRDKTIELPSFTSLEVNGNVDVTFIPTDGPAYLHATQTDSTDAHIDYTLSPTGKLTVAACRDNKGRNHHLLVLGPTPASIDKNGVGDLTLGDLTRTGDLTLTIAGLGRVICGTVDCRSLVVNLSGTGGLRTGRINATSDARFALTGTGRLQLGNICAGRQLDFVQSGSLNVTTGNLHAQTLKLAKQGGGTLTTGFTEATSDASVATDGVGGLTSSFLTAGDQLFLDLRGNVDVCLSNITCNHLKADIGMAGKLTLGHIEARQNAEIHTGTSLQGTITSLLSSGDVVLTKSGSASLRIGDLQSKALTLDASGSGQTAMDKVGVTGDVRLTAQGATTVTVRRLVTPQALGITGKGLCKIEFSRLRANDLTAQIDGPGEITVQGLARNARLSTRQTGRIDAQSLYVDKELQTDGKDIRTAANTH